MAKKLPRLPQLLERKIYKTGQTRGADDDVIYQNRVSRASTVLIPLSHWDRCAKPASGEGVYENGFIVLVPPGEHLNDPHFVKQLAEKGLEIGKNAIVFYETREQWMAWNPEARKWNPGTQRVAPLGGKYVARVPATTAVAEGGRISRGYDSTTMKGAGIRVYEYASSKTTQACRLQLEALFWLCKDSSKVVAANGMAKNDSAARWAAVRKQCETGGLLDLERLRLARLINPQHRTICPLCLEELSSQGFFDRMEQAEGRDVPDLTVTHLNLFHIVELRTGELNHRPYNLGWGHHHCNVVTKDSGIDETIRWMREVLDRNATSGYLPPEKSAS